MCDVSVYNIRVEFLLNSGVLVPIFYYYYYNLINIIILCSHVECHAINNKNE